jgi:hypothetical protein
VRRIGCNDFRQPLFFRKALTYYTLFTYNFYWPVRTLRVRDAEGHWQPRTPAMVAGLTHHVWSLQEWVTYPAVQW